MIRILFAEMIKKQEARVLQLQDHLQASIDSRGHAKGFQIFKMQLSFVSKKKKLPTSNRAIILRFKNECWQTKSRRNDSALVSL